MLMPDIKRLREEIQPSSTDSGDGKGLITFWFGSHIWILIQPVSYIRPHLGHSDDHHPMQEAQV